jgi:Domain of unknown function (DUF4136)
MMHRSQSQIAVSVLATALVLAFHVGLEGVDVRVEHDKTFDFTTVRTWAWNPESPGKIIVSRTQEDDADAMTRKAEPWILDAVAIETMRRGLQPAASQPDLTLTYYLLLTTNMSTQTVGQFLPATAAWGLPPFAPATQSMKLMNHGSLVLDLSAKGVVVWRGVAQAKVSFEIDDQKREALLREGVRDLFKRYPPKR